MPVHELQEQFTEKKNYEAVSFIYFVYLVTSKTRLTELCLRYLFSFTDKKNVCINLTCLAVFLSSENYSDRDLVERCDPQRNVETQNWN